MYYVKGPIGRPSVMLEIDQIKKKKKKKYRISEIGRETGSGVRGGGGSGFY